MLTKRFCQNHRYYESEKVFTSASRPVLYLVYSSTIGKQVNHLKAIETTKHFGFNIEGPFDELYGFTKCIRIGIGLIAALLLTF